VRHEPEFEDEHAAITRILDKANELQDAIHNAMAERDRVLSLLNDARGDHFVSRALHIEQPVLNLLDNAIRQLQAAEGSMSGASSYM
jgi:mevalonate kinase